MSKKEKWRLVVLPRELGVDVVNVEVKVDMVMTLIGRAMMSGGVGDA